MKLFDFLFPFFSCLEKSGGKWEVIFPCLLDPSEKWGENKSSATKDMSSFKTLTETKEFPMEEQVISKDGNSLFRIFRSQLTKIAAAEVSVCAPKGGVCSLGKIGGLGPGGRCPKITRAKRGGGWRSKNLWGNER